MATFLTTAKMDPALAARIEASVRGRTSKPGGPVLSPRVVSIVRLGLLLGVAAFVYSVIGVRTRDRQELERTRTELLDAVRKESASLTEADKSSTARAEASLVAFSRTYDGEVVADELRAPAGLATALARPLVYVRGPIGAFSTSRRIAEIAATSTKDALLLCLLQPPASRVESVMLATVRVAYAGGATIEGHTSNVRRLHDAEVGLPILLPKWAERVQAAPDLVELKKLKRELDRAPIAWAKQAARSGLLLVAMDEPGEGGGPTELDGERTHRVRIGLIDLASEKVLLSMRKLVDPSWISLAKKSEFATGLDSCGLAVDVHDSVRPR